MGELPLCVLRSGHHHQLLSLLLLPCYQVHSNARDKSLSLITFFPPVKFDSFFIFLGESDRGNLFSFGEKFSILRDLALKPVLQTHKEIQTTGGKSSQGKIFPSQRREKLSLGQNSGLGGGNIGGMKLEQGKSINFYNRTKGMNFIRFFLFC